MATNTLTEHTISDTYAGILHASGEQLPASDQKLIYDGVGNASSMSLGRLGNGVTFSGTLSASGAAVLNQGLTVHNQQLIAGAGTVLYNGLSANGLRYPTSGALSGIMIQGANNQLHLHTQLPTQAIPLVFPSPAGTFSNIASITVDTRGRVTDVSTASVGARTVTSTTYLSDSKLIATISPGDTYLVPISWADAPTTAKAIIIFVRPSGTQPGINATYQLFGSHNGSTGSEFPIMWCAGGDHNSSLSPWMAGVQAVVRCDELTPSVNCTYFRRSSSSTSATIEIHILGYQE